ncbi:unannotated protein [freshwater metagenome]|uniref:Unannotated protein n=1 Tax=freshwater metagenome TaxID=449393 RepID=A0A6J7DU88_9ZZZZ
MEAGAWACSTSTTADVFAAFGTRKTLSLAFRYAIKSSTTPPSGVHSNVYCAQPLAIRLRSLVNIELRKSTASGPITDAFPRWETSNIPTASRTAVCSAKTPPPGYSIGINHPPKSAIFALSAMCLSLRGEVFIVQTYRYIYYAEAYEYIKSF